MKKFGIRYQMLHSGRLVMPDDLPDLLSGLKGECFEAGVPGEWKRMLAECFPNRSN